MNKYLDRSDVTLVPSPHPFFIVERITSSIFQSFLFHDLDLQVLSLYSLLSITSFLSIYILTVPVIYRNMAWINRNLKSFEIQFKDYYYLIVSSLLFSFNTVEDFLNYSPPRWARGFTCLFKNQLDMENFRFHFPLNFIFLCLQPLVYPWLNRKVTFHLQTEVTFHLQTVVMLRLPSCSRMASLCA